MIVALAVGLALAIQAYLVKPYQIPSKSMEPTLDVGQRVLVNRLAYRFGDPSAGDVVVFHPPTGAERGRQCGARQTPEGATDDDPATYTGRQPCPLPTPGEADTNFIKRIVAEPGDTLRIENGIPIVNGEPFEGDFDTRACTPAGSGCDFPDEITIPPDMYFMMGDNRGQSDDSRFWGPVPRDQIIGKAFSTYWPPSRWGLL